MDEYYGMFWALYYSNGGSGIPVVMQEAWSISKECAVTQLNLKTKTHNTLLANIAFAIFQSRLQ